MARSKNRVLNVEQENYGEYIKVQVELETGEVVIAAYKRVIWERLPADLQEEADRRIGLPPLVTYGKVGGRGR